MLQEASVKLRWIGLAISLTCLFCSFPTNAEFDIDRPPLNGVTLDHYTRMGSIELGFKYEYGSRTVSFNPKLTLFEFTNTYEAVHYDTMMDYVPILVSAHRAVTARKRSAFYGAVSAWYATIGPDRFSVFAADDSTFPRDFDYEPDADVGVYWMAFTNFPYEIVHSVQKFSSQGCKNESPGAFDVSFLSLRQYYDVFTTPYVRNAVYLKRESAEAPRQICWYMPSSSDPSLPVHINQFSRFSFDEHSNQLVIKKIEITATNVSGVCMIVVLSPHMLHTPLVFVTPEYISSTKSPHVVAWIEFASAEAVEVCVAVTAWKKGSLSEFNFQKLYINLLAILPTAAALYRDGSNTGHYKLQVYASGYDGLPIDRQMLSDDEFVTAFKQWIIELMDGQYQADSYTLELLGFRSMRDGYPPLNLWVDFRFNINSISPDVNVIDVYETIRMNLLHRKLGNEITIVAKTAEHRFLSTYIQELFSAVMSIEFGSFGDQLISASGCCNNDTAVDICLVGGLGGTETFTTNCSGVMAPIADVEFTSTPSKNYADDCKSHVDSRLPCNTYVCEASGSAGALGIAANDKYYRIGNMDFNFSSKGVFSSQDLLRFGTSNVSNISLGSENRIMFQSLFSYFYDDYKILKPIILISPTHRTKSADHFAFTSGMLSAAFNFDSNGFSIYLRDDIHLSPQDMHEVLDGSIIYYTADVEVDWLLFFDANAEYYSFIAPNCSAIDFATSDIVLTSLYYPIYNDTINSYYAAHWLKQESTLQQVCWDHDGIQDAYPIEVGLMKFNSSAPSYFELGHLEFNWIENAEVKAICIGLVFTKQYTIPPQVFVTIEFNGSPVAKIGISAYIEYNSISQAQICAAKLYWSSFVGSQTGSFRIHYLIFDTFAYQQPSVTKPSYTAAQWQLVNFNWSAIPLGVNGNSGLVSLIRNFLNEIIGTSQEIVSDLSVIDYPGVTQIYFTYPNEHREIVYSKSPAEKLLESNSSQPYTQTLVDNFVAPGDQLYLVAYIGMLETCTVAYNAPSQCSSRYYRGPGLQNITKTYAPSCGNVVNESITCLSTIPEIHNNSAVQYFEKSADASSISKLFRYTPAPNNPNPSNPNPSNPNPSNPNPSNPNPSNPNPSNPSPSNPNPSNPNPSNPNPSNPGTNNPDPSGPNSRDPTNDEDSGSNSIVRRGAIAGVVLGVLIADFLVSLV